MDYLPGATVFTITTRFKDLCLKIEPNHLEVFPVELVSKGKNKRDMDYFFINILNSLDVFDWENSEYETYEDSSVISSISKLEIQMDEINGRNIFRIPNMKTKIFVSEKFKTLVEERGITGVQFKELSDYTKGVY